MVKVASWNVNGIRACARKGALDLIWQSEADVICLQEVKVSEADALRNAAPPEYQCYYNLSVNKGRNGVAVYTKMTPKKVSRKIGHERFDTDGRFLCLDFDRYKLINLYLPHGGRDQRQIPYKLEAFRAVREYITALAGQNVLIAADFNMATHDIDVCRAKDNRNNTMFTKAERRAVASMENIGYIDIFRRLYPDKEIYTWWSYAHHCRERNIGWRIDYFWGTETMTELVTDIQIETELSGSDHCPLILEFKE